MVEVVRRQPLRHLADLPFDQAEAVDQFGVGGLAVALHATQRLRHPAIVVDKGGELFADQAAGRVGGTTVAVDGQGDALYFSKSVIPHVPPARVGDPGLPIFFHVGVYAYRPAALAAYAAAAPSALEELEGLEQLRFLDRRLPVRVIEVDAAGHDIWELNNPEDVPVIEAALKRRGID